MSITADIARTYRSPGSVVAKYAVRNGGEDRAFMVLMIACGLIFLAQWPRLSREAYLADQPLDVMIGGALMGWVFLAPLLLYVLAAVSILVVRVFGQSPRPAVARFALFWALLSAAPLWLLYGLAAGFLGQGTALRIIGAVALAAFLWFWWAGLAAACRMST